MFYDCNATNTKHCRDPHNRCYNNWCRCPVGFVSLGNTGAKCPYCFPLNCEKEYEKDICNDRYNFLWECGVGNKCQCSKHSNMDSTGTEVSLFLF